MIGPVWLWVVGFVVGNVVVVVKCSFGAKELIFGFGTIVVCASIEFYFITEGVVQEV